MPATRLEKVEGPCRIDVEVVERTPGGQVVAQLRGGVNDDVEALTCEQGADGFPVADVDAMMGQSPLSLNAGDSGVDEQACSVGLDVDRVSVGTGLQREGLHSRIVGRRAELSTGRMLVGWPRFFEPGVAIPLAE